MSDDATRLGFEVLPILREAGLDVRAILCDATRLAVLRAVLVYEPVSIARAIVERSVGMSNCRELLAGVLRRDPRSDEARAPQSEPEVLLLDAAARVARFYRSTFIGSEHLLLACLSAWSHAVADWLATRGLHEDVLKEYLDGLAPEPDSAVDGDISSIPRAAPLTPADFPPDIRSSDTLELLLDILGLQAEGGGDAARPLLDEAWVRSGRSESHFRDALISVVEHMVRDTDVGPSRDSPST